MTEINDAWNQFNELLDSGTQMSILTKIILSTIGIAIMILVEKNYILRRWEGIVAATDASWDDRIFGPLRTRIYIFTIVGGPILVYYGLILQILVGPKPVLHYLMLYSLY